jgi:hypothetical protein
MILILRMFPCAEAFSVINNLIWSVNVWININEKLLQSFGDLLHRPLLVDLTVEEGTRLKVIYGSADGFHAVDLDSASVYDIYIPKHVSVLTYLL